MIAFGVTIFLLWLLDAPRNSGLMRRATASGFGAAGPLVRLVGRLTDPVLERIEAVGPVRRSLGSPRFRELAVTAVGVVLLAVFAVKLSGHLLDELPLALRAGVVALAAWVGGRVHRDPLAR